MNGQITLKTRNSSVVREFVKTKNMVRKFVNRTLPPPGGGLLSKVYLIVGGVEGVLF